jgi:two-component system, cell cycle response regulator CtrA
MGKNFIETVWGRGYVLRDGAPPMGGSGDLDLEDLRESA